MVTAEAFRAWCDHLQLSQDTAARIAAMRASPPVRKVTGRAGNVAGRYPSPKMQRTIQFESQSVELWAIYAMERDEDVLEYYDQPARIPLRYRAVSGRHTTQWHTPDFFVLRQRSAGWEEWKPLPALDALAVRMPARYHQTTAGHWRCPPGEAYAEPLGLTYRVRSSTEYHPVYIQNLKFLQDFWAYDVASPPSRPPGARPVRAHPQAACRHVLAAHRALVVS
jgi:putative transposase